MRIGMRMGKQYMSRAEASSKLGRWPEGEAWPVRGLARREFIDECGEPFWAARPCKAHAATGAVVELGLTMLLIYELENFLRATSGGKAASRSVPLRLRRA